MTAKDIETKLQYTPVYSDYSDNEVSDGFTSDLLSDVMGNAPEDSVFITIQAHKNTVAVASLAGISAIIICSGRSVPDDMAEAAREEEIAIFTTKDNQFTASWKVKELL